MVEVKYGDIETQSGPFIVQTIGSQPGAPGGDNWSLVATYDKANLTAANHYAFIVTGKAGAYNVSGAFPTNAIVEIALGDTSGLKHPGYVHRFALNDAQLTRPFHAIPFQFVVLFSASPAISDPLWGSTWSNVEDLAVYARVYRNGDPANFAATFEITDLTFLWFDLDAIPSGDQLVEDHWPATPDLNTAYPTWANHFSTTNTPGNSGEKWLHFVNVWYNPRGMGSGSSWFDFGYLPDGTFGTYTTAVGTSGRWGYDSRRVISPPELYAHQYGGFFVLDQPSAGMRIGFRGRDNHAIAGRATQVHRFRYVGIRLDDLPAVEHVFDAHEVSLANAINPGLNVSYLPLEKTSETYVTRPAFFAHGIVDQVSTEHAYGIWVTSNLGRFLWVANGYPHTRGRLEQISDLSFSQDGFGPSSPDVQYRAHWLGVAGSTPNDVRDMHLLQVYLTKDPSNLRIPPAGAANPIVVVPGFEGPALGSLLEPTILPNDEIEELPELEVEAVEGVSGYRRTWRMFDMSRRRVTLSWAPISAADVTTLTTFFAANPAFKLTLRAQDTETALLAMEPPAISQLSGQTFALRFSAAELIFLGP
jgi:hypothetical protein